MQVTTPQCLTHSACSPLAARSFSISLTHSELHFTLAPHSANTSVGYGDCRIASVKHKIDEHRIRYYMH